MDPGRTCYQRNVPLNTLSGLHGVLFNVIEVKCKIMIKGPGTMPPSPGDIQVDSLIPLCLLCFYLFILISVSLVLKCKLLEGWASSIFTTIS